jgi:hypothetical protein
MTKEQQQKIIDLVKREIEINKEHDYSTITDGTADLSQGRLEFAESLLEIINNQEQVT